MSFIKFSGAKNFEKSFISYFGVRKFHFLKYKDFFGGRFFYFLSFGFFEFWPRQPHDILLLQQWDILNTNYNTTLVSRMYILKEVCYMRISIPAIYFFEGSVIISREKLERSTCQRHCVYFTTLVAGTHYNKRSVVRKSLKGMFIWGKPLQPCSFIGAFFFPVFFV